MFYSIGEKYDKKLDMMSTALGSLKAYDQRLSFAVGRLDMLKGIVLSFTHEPRHEKTGLRGFQPGLTQTGLYSLGRKLEY